MRSAFERRRNLVLDLIQEIPDLKVNSPMGAFYLFPECKSYFGKKTTKGHVIANSTELAMYLLEVGHVACVAGAAFGAPECIRISYATSDEKLIEAFGRIKKSLAQLH